MSATADVARPIERERVVIAQRYAGMPGIALGGYVGGMLASKLDGATVETSFRAPTPMGEELTLGVGWDHVVLSDGDVALAEARRGNLDLDIPPVPSLSEATAASADFPGHHVHPFSSCFTCGPDRHPDDGLRIFAGPLAGTDLVAAPWTPDHGLADRAGDVRLEFIWAALDCPQLWALITNAAGDSDERVVTGAMTVRIGASPRAGEPHVVSAWPVRRSGRLIFAGAAIHSERGELLVAALQRAVVVPGMGVPLGLSATKQGEGR